MTNDKDVKEIVLIAEARAEVLGGGIIGLVKALKEIEEKTISQDLALLKRTYNLSTGTGKDESFELVLDQLARTPQRLLRAYERYIEAETRAQRYTYESNN